MKAEIFYLEDQWEVVQEISQLLREKIYPGLKVVSYQIDDINENNNLDEIAARYQKLIRASIKPETRPEKRVELTTEIRRHYGGGYLYIRIYYFWNYTTFLGGDQLVAFLPAVAVHDRLFIVPKDIDKILRSEGEEVEFLKPLAAEGAIRLDYHDRASIPSVVAEVSRNLCDEFRYNLRASASLMPDHDFSIPELSAGLGVDPGFLQYFLKSEVSSISFYKQLVCDARPKEIPFGRWSAVTLNIQNNTNLDFSNLEVDITGPVEIRPTRRIEVDLPSHDAVEVKISLKPQDRGEFPLEIVLMLPDDRIYHEYLHVHDIWLDCE